MTRPRQREYVYMAAAFILGMWAAVGVVEQDTMDIEKAAGQEMVSRDDGITPTGGLVSPVPAAPRWAFYLTPPRPCIGRGGEQWIRQWGDGKKPPFPTCVNARKP